MKALNQMALTAGSVYDLYLDVVYLEYLERAWKAGEHMFREGLLTG